MPRRTKAQIEFGKELEARMLRIADKPVTKTMSYKERFEILHCRHFKEFCELREEFKKKKALARKKASHARA